MEKDIIEAMQASIDEAVDHYKNQKIIIDLWQKDAPGAGSGDNVSAGIIEKFVLQKKEKLNSYESDEEIKSMLSLIKSQSEALQDNIGGILDDNQDQVAKEIIDALDIILGQVERFYVSYKSRADKLLIKMRDEDMTHSQKFDAFVEVLRKCLAEMINETLSAIYRGIKITGNPIYDIVLDEFNSFLKSIGVYTWNVKIGSKMDPDVCVYADDAICKVTEKIEEDDCVYEISQLPYMLNDDICLSPGKVSTWRFDK